MPETAPSPELTSLVERMEAAAVRAEDAAARAEATQDARMEAEARVHTDMPTAPSRDLLAAPVDPTAGHRGVDPRAPTPYGQPIVPQNPWLTPNAAGTPYGPVIVVPMPWPMPWGQVAPVVNPGVASGAAAATPGTSEPVASGGSALTADELRELVRAELAAATPPAPVEPGVTAADLAAMEDRLGERLSSSLERERRLTEEIARQEADAAVGRRVRQDPVDPEEGTPTVDEPGDERAVRRVRLDPSLGFPVRELRPYSGMTFGEGSQMVLGLAADWGPFQSGSRFDLVPEVSVAFGSGQPTWMAATNLQYRTGWVLERDSFWINPLAQIGLGLTNRDNFEAVLNAAYGATIQLSGIRGRNGAPVNLFVAHQGIDLFNRSSLIIGLSLER